MQKRLISIHVDVYRRIETRMEPVGDAWRLRAEVGVGEIGRGGEQTASATLTPYSFLQMRISNRSMYTYQSSNNCVNIPNAERMASAGRGLRPVVGRGSQIRAISIDDGIVAMLR